MKEIEETKKPMVDTPPVKRKLDLEKESEKKKAKFTIATSSEVKDEEKDEIKKEEEEEESIINIKKMTPKQLIKVSKKIETSR